ncbi:hypothetical protein HID58_079789 [Brassica napus]|uniref:Uncharacterized protein n=1 Tax=Brassica napus TaxID=3708 RepID=A0ABQ7Y312_BRANA|nr:hypothetical protein HID58_079789 [Brassica napus]
MHLTPWMQPRGCESVNELEWMSYSKDQKEDPLVTEETKDKDLNVPLDPMTRSKQARDVINLSRITSGVEPYSSSKGCIIFKSIFSAI